VDFLKRIMPYDWQEILADVMEAKFFFNLANFLEEQYANSIIYPAYENIFRALYLTPYEKTRIVILGQDPYHEENQAHGLSFSVPGGVSLPPSLCNIFKEYANDTGFSEPICGDLEKWAKQGVLLLNTVLTVQKSRANSHADKGWEIFTDAIIKKLSVKQTPVIFVLWGRSAQAKMSLISKNHHILTAPHPSPLSAHRGFFSSAPFSKINAKLDNLNQKKIDWRLV